MKTFILFILAYLLGSLLPGVWIGKLKYQKDIRTLGSGNTGTTNTFRVLGKKAGTVVMLIDVLKGTIATMFPFLFGLDINPLWFGLAAILGHTFPIFGKFKGGKAVATSGGMLLAYSPTFFLFCFCLFVLFLFLTSTVSLSSILLALSTTASTFLLPTYIPEILPEQDWLLHVMTLCLTIFIIIRHKQNIQRMIQGTESTIPFGLRKQKNR